MKSIATQINDLKGLYQFKSPYHKDERLLPFEIVGNSYNEECPVKVETVEYKALKKYNIKDVYNQIIQFINWFNHQNQAQ